MSRTSAPKPDAHKRLSSGARRAHLVGIAGAGMRSLASLLQSQGWQTSGSDMSADVPQLAGCRIACGHSAETIDPSVELVVHSTAVPANNPELVRARELRLDVVSYPQMLGRLMQSRTGVAIAGTHGKSTTTAMTAEILSAAGMDPTYIYGAEPVTGGTGGHAGAGAWMLAEACEYQANFCELSPQMAAILGIERDHFDCFATSADVEQAFGQFLTRLPSDGLIVANADCAVTRRVVAGAACPSESFGLKPSATWRAVALTERRGYYAFTLRCRGRRVCEINLSVPGRHNVHNALAAAALASHCGASALAIQAGLARFAGLRRRLEVLQSAPGPAIVDDYAHHPTEVSAALTTVRQMFPAHRIVCVFQPHQASRTQALADEFARSLLAADTILLTDVFRAREGQPKPGEFTAADLAKRLQSLTKRPIELAKSGEIHDHLRTALGAGDVLVTLGAGDIGKVAHGVGQGLRRFRQAG